MADINRWLQSRDSATQRINASLVATTQADAAEIQELEHAKARPRPKSRLASYLNTYRNAEKTEPASFEWSGLPVQDRIYVPRPDDMSNTILQQIMAGPTHNLPAGYNSLVLHMIEDHRHLTAENHEQSQKLQAEIESHLEDNEQYRRTLQLYNQHPVRHTSPSQSMTLTSRAILTADSAREVSLSSPRQGTNTRGHGATEVDVLSDEIDSWSGHLIEDRLPPQHIAFVSCLTARLANRLDCSPMDLFNEIAEACIETLEQNVSDAPASVRSDLRSITAFNSSRDECDRNMQNIELQNFSHPTLAGSGMAKDSGHQRSFSFQLGDDAKTPPLSKAIVEPGKAEFVRHRMPPGDDDALLQGNKVERSSDQSSEAASLDIFFYQNTGISAAKSSLKSRTHRENSSRSVVTAIKDSSYRSSSSPQEQSRRLYQATARGSLGGSEQNPIAIAAARAAGFRDISDTKAGYGGGLSEP